MAVRRNYLTPGSKPKSSGTNRVTPGSKAKASGPGGVVGLVAKGAKGYQEARSRAVARESGKVTGYTAGSYRSKPSSPTRSRDAASARMAGQASARSGGAKPSAGSAATGRKRVTVKAGDTLSAIAKREGVSLAALKQANKGRAVLDRIYSGSKVVIPGKKKK